MNDVFSFYLGVFNFIYVTDLKIFKIVSNFSDFVILNYFTIPHILLRLKNVLLEFMLIVERCLLA
jgi:hypothetical protein